MTLRLDEDIEGRLRAMAEREGISQQEVIRRAIVERDERSRLHDDVHEAGVRAVSRYASLLDRLSQ